MFEQLIDTLVRLDREAYVGVGYGHRVSDVSGYRNGFNPTSVTHASGSLNSMASQVSSSTDTPLYPNIINRGQRSSEALLNVATECYIEGVSTREVRKIFNLFGIETISSTQVSNTSKKLDDSFESWRNRDLGEFPYLMLDAGYEKLLFAMLQFLSPSVLTGLESAGSVMRMAINPSD